MSIATGKNLRLFTSASEQALLRPENNTVNSCSHHGAVVVNGGKIIGQGCNSNRTYVWGRQFSSCHAELAAIIDAIRNMNRVNNSRKKIRGEFRHCLKWG